MDTNTKSLLKHTILGLVSGGALSALYANNRRKSDEAEEAAYQDGVGKNQITVPLSRKHYLKAVGLKKDEVPKKKPTEAVTQGLQPMDIAALKRAILKARAEKTAACCKTPKKATCGAAPKKATCGAAPKKATCGTAPKKATCGTAPKKATCCKAEAPQSIKAKTTSVSTLSGFRGKSKIAQLRNPKGRFSTEEGLGKAAGIFDKIDYNTRGVIRDGLGFAGGTVAGLAVVKAVSDRIAINRKRIQVEKARRRYANMISKEVGDEDLPFYTKTAQDRGVIPSVLGLAGLTGAGAATLSGLLMYKIIENRRKASERAADKDNQKFPEHKSIKFTFK